MVVDDDFRADEEAERREAAEAQEPTLEGKIGAAIIPGIGTGLATGIALWNIDTEVAGVNLPDASLPGGLAVGGLTTYYLAGSIDNRVARTVIKGLSAGAGAFAILAYQQMVPGAPDITGTLIEYANMTGAEINPENGLAKLGIALVPTTIAYSLTSGAIDLLVNSRSRARNFRARAGRWAGRRRDDLRRVPGEIERVGEQRRERIAERAEEGYTRAWWQSIGWGALTAAATYFGAEHGLDQLVNLAQTIGNETLTNWTTSLKDFAGTYLKQNAKMLAMQTGTLATYVHASKIAWGPERFLTKLPAVIGGGYALSELPVTSDGETGPQWLLSQSEITQPYIGDGNAEWAVGAGAAFAAYSLLSSGVVRERTGRAIGAGGRAVGRGIRGGADMVRDRLPARENTSMLPYVVTLVGAGGVYLGAEPLMDLYADRLLSSEVAEKIAQGRGPLVNGEWLKENTDIGGLITTTGVSYLGSMVLPEGFRTPAKVATACAAGAAFYFGVGDVLDTWWVPAEAQAVGVGVASLGVLEGTKHIISGIYKSATADYANNSNNQSS